MLVRATAEQLRFFPEELKQRFKKEDESTTSKCRNLFLADIEISELTMFTLYWTHPGHIFCKIKDANVQIAGTGKIKDKHFVILLYENPCN